MGALEVQEQKENAEMQEKYKKIFDKISNLSEMSMLSSTTSNQMTTAEKYKFKEDIYKKIGILYRESQQLLLEGYTRLRKEFRQCEDESHKAQAKYIESTKAIS